jgi:UDP-N-acetylmuramoyl-L-alanyl-D-glutamate--2,6-diaminopimelate ligase
MKLRRLLDETPVVLCHQTGDVDVTSVENHSGMVSPGALFIAVKGFSTDGHDYIPEAMEAGAAAVITERAVDYQGSIPVLINPSGDNRSLLAKVSAEFYRHPWREMTAAGITGTNGKTSTAHMLRWILEGNGTPTGIMGTVGHIAAGKSFPASVTTPDSLQVARYMRLMADGGDRACVMEVSSHALHLDRVAQVEFDIALFTNISRDHLDFHGGMDEYFRAKKKIFSLLKSEGHAIVGTYASPWPDIPGALTFGHRAEDHYRITDARSSVAGSTFTLVSPEGSVRAETRAPGRFNVYNAAGALAAAAQAGIRLESAAEALATFTGVPGRMESVDCGQGFLVAVDYAHTPDALERVLSQGKAIAPGRLITVFGCGGDRDSTKRPIMGEIASRLSDIAIVTSDNPRTEDPMTIIRGILEGIPVGCGVKVEPDRALAIEQAVRIAEPGDAVIIAGKGHEDYQILGTKKIHFDDREHARAALAGRGYSCVL